MNILLVDDDQLLTTLLKMQLEEKGHRIDVAYNGYDGSGLALKNAYDVIILDLMLPGINGRKVCTKLRENQVETPILMISSLGSAEEKHSGIMAGANDYMVKPLPFEVLHEKIILLGQMRRNSSG